MSDYIPKDIVAEILRLLPVKTLLRFRCVCKTWNQIIDSEWFKLNHLALQNPKFIAEYEEEELLILDPHKLPSHGTLNRPVDDETKRLHLVGTFHGLVCLYDDVWKLFLLWNPCIRKFATLLLPQFMGFDWIRPDGSSHGTCSGFWFDPFNQVLKVIMFHLDQDEQVYDDDEEMYGGLYSSELRDWKRISLQDVQFYHALEATPPVMIQGVAHWKAEYHYCETERDIAIVSFDFAQERFDRMEAISVQEGWDSPVLCSWEGGLSLVYIDPNRKCDIYLRKNDSWAHVFSIGLMQNVSCVLWGAVEVEEKHKNARIVATMGDEMVLFDTKTNRCMSLIKQIKDPSRFAIADGYVESLLYVTNFIRPHS